MGERSRIFPIWIRCFLSRLIAMKSPGTWNWNKTTNKCFLLPTSSSSRKILSEVLYMTRTYIRTNFCKRELARPSLCAWSPFSRCSTAAQSPFNRRSTVVRLNDRCGELIDKWKLFKLHDIPWLQNFNFNLPRFWPRKAYFHSQRAISSALNSQNRKSGVVSSTSQQCVCSCEITCSLLMHCDVTDGN